MYHISYRTTFRVNHSGYYFRDKQGYLCISLSSYNLITIEPILFQLYIYGPSLSSQPALCYVQDSIRP